MKQFQRRTILFYSIVYTLYFSSFLNAGTLGDINNDDTINSEEAIYALQVTSGIKKQLTINVADNSNALDVNGNINASGTITGQLYSHYDDIEKENVNSITKVLELKENPGVLFITSFCYAPYQSSTELDSSIHLSINIDNIKCGADSSGVAKGNSVSHRSSATCIKKLNIGTHELNVSCAGWRIPVPEKLTLQYMILNDN